MKLFIEENIRYLFLAFLVVFSAIHLKDSYQDNAKKRPLTKPFLLPMIILYYLFSTNAPSWVLIVALVTSWLGDVLLIPKSQKWFLAGGISFLLSHISFICVYAPNVAFANVNVFIVIPIALCYIGVIVFVFKKLWKTVSKSMKIPMVLYLITNGTMNIFALMQLISSPSVGSAVAYCGAVLFFISDCTLYFVRFYPKKDVIFKRHFTVMFTYILGEFLIAQGVLLLAK